jgi:hypothetical protein
MGVYFHSIQRAATNESRLEGFPQGANVLGISCRG